MGNPPLCHKAAAKFEDTRLSALEHRRAVRKFVAQPLNNPGAWPCSRAAAPGSATPELDSTHMNGLTDDKKRSVVPNVCVCVARRESWGRSAVASCSAITWQDGCTCCVTWYCRESTEPYSSTTCVWFTRLNVSPSKRLVDWAKFQ